MKSDPATTPRRFQPYPAYRDSGIEWLGEIPAHWEVKRLKLLLAEPLQYGANEAAELDDPDLPRYVRITDIDENDRLRDETFKSLPADVAREYLLREGDLLFARSGATAGKTFLYRKAWGECAYAGYLIRARLDGRKCRPELVRYFTASSGYWDWLASSFIQATIQNVSAERYASLPLPLSPLSEQHAIAAFLDRETARIDALVAKKERLIELLQEKRTALITRAVTKGLDPNLPMKDSGVEWLGEIPVHWEVEENRWLFRESDKRSTLGDEELLTVSHITGVTRRSDKPDVTMIEAESHEGYKICENGELAINTMWAWMGALGIARELGMVSPSYNVFQIADPRLGANYYDYLCRIPLHVAEIIRHSKGIWQSRLRLYPDAFREIVTPLPPEREQRAIAVFLDGETATIDALVTKVSDASDHLKELRTALISAAVTGKVDVRGEISPPA